MTAVEDHQDDMVAIMDSIGEDYPERFLDEDGELAVGVAALLGAGASQVAAGTMSLWTLDALLEQWMALVTLFMDGYGLEGLMTRWFDEGACSELAEEREWPGGALTAFFELLARELERYVAWRASGSSVRFGPLLSGS